MELMRSLLLCTLVVYFSQTLGDSSPNKRDLDTDVRSNSTTIYHQKSQPKKFMLNLSGPHLVNITSDLEHLFVDERCKECIPCMERAIKLYKAHKDIMKKRLTTSDVHKNLRIKQYKIQSRSKRNLDRELKIIRSKPKKKPSKSVTVTKYNVDGEVYGIKVKESLVQDGERNNNGTSICRVYSVKKTYNCDSPESEMFLTSAKRKMSKKNKKEKEKDKTTTVVSTQKALPVPPSFRKRQVDQSQIPENYEFSIEEMYH